MSDNRGNLLYSSFKVSYFIATVAVLLLPAVVVSFENFFDRSVLSTFLEPLASLFS
jgi:hypothetical protein